MSASWQQLLHVIMVLTSAVPSKNSNGNNVLSVGKGMLSLNFLFSIPSHLLLDPGRRFANTDTVGEILGQGYKNKHCLFYNNKNDHFLSEEQ